MHVHAHVALPDRLLIVLLLISAMQAGGPLLVTDPATGQTYTFSSAADFNAFWSSKGAAAAPSSGSQRTSSGEASPGPRAAAGGVGGASGWRSRHVRLDRSSKGKQDAMQSQHDRVDDERVQHHHDDDDDGDGDDDDDDDDGDDVQRNGGRTGVAFVERDAVSGAASPSTPSATHAAPLSPSPLGGRRLWNPLRGHGHDESHVVSGRKHKARREFRRIHLLQRIAAHRPDSGVWCMAWSADGQRLATAGQDGVLCVYRVMSRMEAHAEHAAAHGGVIIGSPQQQQQQAARGSREGGKGTQAALLRVEHQWSGHEDDILALAWTQDGCILTGSADKTVKLWDPSSRFGLLCSFTHTDFVTAVDTHPDGVHFLAATLDKRLRIWSLVERRVVHWVDVDGFITAAKFCVGGSLCAVGDHEGKCTFFETHGLRWVTQIRARSRRGKNSKGNKICGIQNGPDNAQILISSNDGRIRLCNMADYSFVCKYRGHSNRELQLQANFSEDGTYVISGSDDGHVYVWNRVNMYASTINQLTNRMTFSERKDRNRSFEYWRASHGTVTAATFVPLGARRTYLQTGNALEDEDEEGEEGGEARFIVCADSCGVITVFENRRLPPKRHLLHNLRKRVGNRAFGAPRSGAPMPVGGRDVDEFVGNGGVGGGGGGSGDAMSDMSTRRRVDGDGNGRGGKVPW